LRSRAARSSSPGFSRAIRVIWPATTTPGACLSSLGLVYDSAPSMRAPASSSISSATSRTLPLTGPAMLICWA
jgi:hypothetical protein